MQVRSENPGLNPGTAFETVRLECKNGKAPIMGRITLNRTMAQFGCKLSCTPKLGNPRESRLDGKSKEAVEVNAKIDKLLLAINSAYESLVERLTSSLRTPKIFVKEFSYFLMPCH